MEGGQKNFSHSFFLILQHWWMFWAIIHFYFQKKSQKIYFIFYFQGHTNSKNMEFVCSRFFLKKQKIYKKLMLKKTLFQTRKFKRKISLPLALSTLRGMAWTHNNSNFQVYTGKKKMHGLWKTAEIAVKLWILPGNNTKEHCPRAIESLFCIGNLHKWHQTRNMSSGHGTAGG